MDILPNNIVQISAQQRFFDAIKAKYPTNKSLVNEIAELLDISMDSAYRRMRGEKEMTMDELHKLSVRFGISVDKVMHLKSDYYLFRDYAVGQDKLNFNEQLEHHFKSLGQLKMSASSELIFFTRDISIFYFYQFPELLAFKHYYWMKSVFNHPEYQKLKFSIKEESKRISGKGFQAARIFSEIEGTEIWSAENFSLILQQFRFLKDMQLFTEPGEPDLLYEKLICLIDHIEQQAEAGKKFIYGQRPDEHSGKFKLYINEFMHGGNNILVRSGDHWICYINHSIMNYLRTDDPVFCDYVRQRVDEVVRRSTLISGTGEKQRKQFFNRLRETIEQYRHH